MQKNLKTRIFMTNSCIFLNSILKCRLKLPMILSFHYFDSLLTLFWVRLAVKDAVHPGPAILKKFLCPTLHESYMLTWAEHWIQAYNQPNAKYVYQSIWSAYLRYMSEVTASHDWNRSNVRMYLCVVLGVSLCLPVEDLKGLIQAVGGLVVEFHVRLER